MNINKCLYNGVLKQDSLYHNTIKLETDWKNATKYFNLYFNHKDFKVIESNIFSLKNLIAFKEYGLYYSKIDIILSLLHDLKENIYPNYKNLF